MTPPQQAVTTGGQVPVPGVKPAPPVAAKPRKSNWEMLCEMTDKQKDGETALETGSISSSVFTNNVPTHQVMYPGGMSYHPQNGQHPPAPIIMVPPHHVHSYTTPSGAPYPLGGPISVNLPPSGPTPAAHPSPSVGSEISQNSSWDMLTKLTEQQSRLQQIQNNTAGNESVV